MRTNQYIMVDKYVMILVLMLDLGILMCKRTHNCSIGIFASHLLQVIY